MNTLASGASAPSSPQAGQLWHDTTNNIIKLRSANNTTWIALLNINESFYLSSPAMQGVACTSNRLVNGAFAVDQVYEGGSYTIPSNNTYTYTADQWVAACLSSTAAGVTAQRVSDAPAGFSHSLKMTVGTGASSVAATDYLVLWQPIEASSINDLSFGTVNAGYLSLSFWVKASIAGTYSVVMQNAAGNRTLVNKFTVNTGGTWQFITIPAIPCDQSGTWTSGTAACLNLYFTVAVGSTYQTSTFNAWLGATYFSANTQTNSVLTTSGATFQVAGVMLNAGVFPMPFEKRTLQQDLSACQRYYEKTFHIGTGVSQFGGTSLGEIGLYSCNTAAGVNYTWWPFCERKRIAPTIATYNPLNNNGNWRDITTSADKTMSIMTPTEWGTGLMVNGTTAVGDNLRVHVIANARM